MTYTHSAPHRRGVPLLGPVLPPDPADAHSSQDDARHTQAHLSRRQEQEAPQDLAAGAHRAPGIAPESAPIWLRRGFTSYGPCPRARAAVGWSSGATGNAGKFFFLKIFFNFLFRALTRVSPLTGARLVLSLVLKQHARARAHTRLQSHNAPAWKHLNGAGQL